MQSTGSSDIFSLFGGTSQVLLFSFVILASIVLVFFAVKAYFKMRGSGVQNGIQYGGAGYQGALVVTESRDEAFARRLDNMVETEEAYDLAQLLPRARELGAIAKTTFNTAPVLDTASAGVLAVIEKVMVEMESGCRVLLNTSLESMVNLSNEGARTLTTKLSLTGIELQFAVVDRTGRLILALDHLGFRKRSRQDHINRSVVIEVLRKAGVWYLEIPQHYSEDDVRAQITSIIGEKASGQSGAEVA